MTTPICAICHESLDDESGHHQLACGHTFHPSCIIQWFRNGHNTCPLCKDVTLNDNVRGYWQKVDCIREIKKMGRLKTCPPKVKKMLSNIKKHEQLYKNTRSDIRQFRKAHKDVFDEYKRLTTQSWKLSRRMALEERGLLAHITINPIYIRKEDCGRSSSI